MDSIGHGWEIGNLSFSDFSFKLFFIAFFIIRSKQFWKATYGKPKLEILMKSHVPITALLKTLCHLPWCSAGFQPNCGPRNRHYWRILQFPGKSVSIVLFIVVLGCVEVFSKTTVSVLVLLLCFSNIPLRNTVYYAAAETLREIGQGLAARISVYSLEKQEGPRGI